MTPELDEGGGNFALVPRVEAELAGSFNPKARRPLQPGSTAARKRDGNEAVLGGQAEGGARPA